MLPNFSYTRPRNIQEVAGQLNSADIRVHAGGTDLLGCLRDGVLQASRLVSISRISELRRIEETADGGLRLGALATLSEIAAHPVIKKRYQALAQGAAAAASPQLRNQGTIGGNICQKPRCWYYRGEFHCLRKGGEQCFAVDGENQFHCILGGRNCFIVHPSDPSPALVALEAQARVESPRGQRTIPLASFHMDPAQDPRRETVLETDEVVTHILLPPVQAGLQSSYRKIRARQSWDFALAGVALALLMDGDRVVAGRMVLSGAAPVPWRAREAEKVLTGRPLDQNTAAVAARAAMQEARPMSQNGYKVPLFLGVIEEELLAYGGGK